MAERLAQDEESRSVTWQSSRISTTTAATPSKTRPTGLVLGMLYGLGFAVLASPRAIIPGAGLLWGLAYALLLWLANPFGSLTVMMAATPDAMLDSLRSRFPAWLM